MLLYSFLADPLTMFVILLSIQSPLKGCSGSELVMAEKETQGLAEGERDLDEWKLWRGEIGPSIAEELASK